MESLLKPIQCTKCFEHLKNPVLLPCGNAICERHQHEEERDDKKSIYCSVCDLHHEIPNGGFVRMLALEKLIEQKIDCIDLGDEYHFAYEKLRDFSDLFERFEKLKNNPGEKVYNKISELKSEIDLRREELKNKIDEDALSIIKKLDEYEAECKAHIISIKVKSNKLNEWKEDLDRWRKQMRTFEKDIDKWTKIYEESSSKYDEMSIEYNSFNDNLFLNKLNQYQKLKLFVSDDLDMIKNHSITYMVKNVTQTIKDNKDIVLYSEKSRAFGLNWFFKVKTSTDDNNETIKHVGIFLFVEGNFSNETCDVCFDSVILHRADPSKNITKNVKYDYSESIGFGHALMIKLNDLVNNEGFFDAKNDCFKVQVLIKSVEFKSIQE